MKYNNNDCVVYTTTPTPTTTTASTPTPTCGIGLLSNVNGDCIKCEGAFVYPITTVNCECAAYAEYEKISGYEIKSSCVCMVI